MGAADRLPRRPGRGRRRADGGVAGDRRRHRAAARTRPVPGPVRCRLRRSRASSARCSAACSSRPSHWRWVFYINVPVGIVALLVIAAVLHMPAPRAAPRIDYLGAGLLIAAVAAAHPGHVVRRRPSTPGARPHRRPRGVARRSCCSALFVWHGAPGRRARRCRCACSGSSAFRSPPSSASSIGFAMFGAMIFIPLFLQVVHGVSPTMSGVHMLPLVVGLLLAHHRLRADRQPRPAATRSSRSPAPASWRSACSCSHRLESSTGRRG